MKQVRNYREAYIAELCLQIAPNDSSADAVKRNLRQFYHRDSRQDVGMGFLCERRIIADNGVDGFIELVSIPEIFATAEEAEEFFNDFIFIPEVNSNYDCTGKPFTCWHKIARRGSRYVIYHQVSIDC